MNSANGIVYVQEDEHTPSHPAFNSTTTVHHSFGTHAGPWLFAEVIAGAHCSSWRLNMLVTWFQTAWHDPALSKWPTSTSLSTIVAAAHIQLGVM